MGAEARRVVEVGVERHRQELPRAANRLRRQPELLLDVAQVVPIVRVVPRVVREHQTPGHIRNLGASG